MEEEWRPVPSRPGIMASNHGFIMTPEVTITMPNGGVRTIKTKPRRGCVCRSNKNASHVYLNIQHSKYGTMKAHRLVCEAFHGPPPFPRAVVIHLDEDGTNNRADNLKWGTQKENLNMPKFLAYCSSRTGENSPYIKGMRKKGKEVTHGNASANH